MQLYYLLFTSFFKIGIFTFGGGLTMLPMLEREIINKQKWVDKDTLLDYYAMGQCTPGIIAVNVATFIGYKQKGTLGAIVATMGMVTPSLFIILTIAILLEPYMYLAIVQSAFAGIRVGVCALLVQSVIRLGKQGIQDQKGLVAATICFILVSFVNVSLSLIVIAIIVFAVLLVMKEGKKL